jgi:CRISPR-associated endonuclease/helicase Cas3
MRSFWRLKNLTKEYMEYKLYSHPDVLLKDHLTNVYESGLAMFDKKGIYSEQRDVLRYSLLFHDIGKASSYFQAYIKKNAVKSELSRHTAISALWTFYYLSEVLNLGKENLLIGYLTVKNHHTDFNDLTNMLSPPSEDLMSISKSIDYNELSAILSIALDQEILLSHDLFCVALDKAKKSSLMSVFRGMIRQLSADFWIKLNYLFSIMILADKNDAVFKADRNEKDLQIWSNGLIDDFRKSLPYSDSLMDRIRNGAYDELVNSPEISQRIQSINLPTGSGKTISSLSYALKLRKQHPELERVIYCLPFTSIIDQNFNVYKRILAYNSVEATNDALLAHHHLIDFFYKSTNDEYRDDKAEFLIETWDSELIVTTFIQFIYTILPYRNRTLKRFHRLANSVVILDEVQNIPQRYWELIRNTLQSISERLNMYILLVTATMPLIFPSEEIVEVAASKDVWFSSLNRVELNISMLKTARIVEELADIILQEYNINPNLNRLIILNTIKSSLLLFNLLSDVLPQERLIYLSTNIVPKHRLERIERIRQSDEEGLVVISTQLVEAGVDIDVDEVYRDLAPLDSIIQACGRCNRSNNKSIGRVTLVQLKDEKKPFWRYVYDEVLINATSKALSRYDIVIQENKFQEMITGYYRYLNEALSADKSRIILENLKKLRYDSALHYSRENKDALQIFEELPVTTVFVEIDEEATEVMSEYLSFPTSLFENDFEQNARRKDIIKRMSPFLINVPQKFYKNEEGIIILTKDMLRTTYDITTGFKRESSIEDYIF